MKKITFFNHLTRDLIPFWNKMADFEHGGFYSYADNLAKIDNKADKSIILQNRIMWFYSNSYLLLKNPNLLSYAKHSFEFFKKYSFDKKRGGVYWSTDYLGNPKDTTKHTYNMAFSIYALSSYYEASNNIDALVFALSIFNTIETKCKDIGGYREAFDISFNEINNDHLSENGVMAKRTMNTLLHIIEAYTNLYRVSQDETVKIALKNGLELFINNIYNKNKAICEVFLSNDYKSLIDLESFGHEIEVSWLLKKAIDLIDDKDLASTLNPILITLANSVYERGMSINKDRIYYEEENKVILKKSAWWVEAEGVIGFYNAYELTGDKKYLETSEKIWKFINEKIIDKNTGEWIEDYYDDETKNTNNQALVHAWKCPYHNGRMCMEMINRLTNLKPISSSSSVIKLYNYLLNVSHNKVLFGHQNSTFIKISKKYDSDVREMVNDIPAIIGIDTLALAGAEMDKQSQEKSLLKSIKVSINANKENAIITLSCHMPNFSSKNIYIDKDGQYKFNKCDFMDCKDKSNNVMNEILDGGKYHKEFISYLDLIVKYAKALKELDIPIIFRPWHECNGNWFFWGSDIDDKKYIEVFRYTKKYLDSQGVNNLLYVYSPNGPFKTTDEYMKRYPGDDVIDILALDYYDDYMYQEPYRNKFFSELDESSNIIYKLALMHDKICAISEVGIRVSKDPSNNDLNGLLRKNNPMKGHDWFIKVGEIAIKYNMPYYLVWGNFEKDNTYLPYINEDNSPHEMVDDFIEFYKWPYSIFAKNVKM